MKKITSNARRRLGLPGRPALVLDPGQTAEISDEQIFSLKGNRIASRWLASGILVIEGEEAEAKPAPRVRPPEPAKKPEPAQADLPAGVTGDGVETVHIGGGWFRVYVNGFEVSDGNVRKDKAETIAKEYE